MGTWGTGIFDDDVANDVRDDYLDQIDRGDAADRAANAVMRKYRGELEDPDEGPVVALALAWLLVDAGGLRHPAIDMALEITRTGAGLDRWREAGEPDLSERLGVYALVAQHITEARPASRNSDRVRTQAQREHS